MPKAPPIAVIESAKRIAHNHPTTMGVVNGAVTNLASADNDVRVIVQYHPLGDLNRYRAQADEIIPGFIDKIGSLAMRVTAHGEEAPVNVRTLIVADYADGSAQVTNVLSDQAGSTIQIVNSPNPIPGLYTALCVAVSKAGLFINELEENNRTSVRVYLE